MVLKVGCASIQVQNEAPSFKLSVGTEAIRRKVEKLKIKLKMCKELLQKTDTVNLYNYNVTEDVER